MTQIFTGDGLGLSGSSLSRLGDYGPKGTHSLGQSGESIYINLANGNLVISQLDKFLTSSGQELDLNYSYNTLAQTKSSWCFNTQSRLIINQAPNNIDSIITRIDEDGHHSYFMFNSTTNSYLAMDGRAANIRFKNGSWDYKDGGSTRRYEYNLEGQLMSIGNNDKPLFIFNYERGLLESISTSNDKQTMNWIFIQANGVTLLTDVTMLNLGVIVHHLHYEYDKYNRLQKVLRAIDLTKNSMTYWISYEYLNDSNLISTIRQFDGVTLKIQYDELSRVKQIIDGEGYITSYDYLKGQTKVTQASHESWTYFYDEAARLCGIDGPDDFHLKYEYTNNQLSSITQGKLRWLFRYNNFGDCLQVEEPSGKITNRCYDNEHHITKQTSFNAHFSIDNCQTSYFIYDATGLLRFYVANDGTVTEHRYNADGLRSSTRIFLKNSFSLSSKFIQPTLNELNHWVLLQDKKDTTLTTYLYDFSGLLSEEIHYTELDSEAVGCYTSAIKTYYRYDLQGRLMEKSEPFEDGFSFTHYIYDELGRLLQSIDSLGNQQQIEYDDEHQSIIQTDAKGLKTIKIYDNRGLILTSTSTTANKIFDSTSYHYDEQSRLYAQTSSDGITQFFFYNKQGNIQANITNYGLVKEYIYNDAGILIQTIYYEQLVNTSTWFDTTAIYELIKPKPSLKDRVTQTIYNSSCQISYQIDSQGSAISYQYDSLNNLIKQTSHALLLAKFQPKQILDYASIHLETSVDDRSIYYFYNTAGLLSAEINAEGGAISYQYDKTGHIVEICHYFNQVSQLPIDIWLQPPTNSKDRHTYYLYNAAGLKIATIDADGYLETYNYNERGLLQEKCNFYISINEEAVRTIMQTSCFSLHKSNNDRITQYRYDSLDRIIQETTQTGLIINYVYDANGLLLSKTSQDAKTHDLRQQRFRYDALGRISMSLDAEGSSLLQTKHDSYDTVTESEQNIIWQEHSLSYEYDNQGRLIRQTNALLQSTYFFYGENSLLTHIINHDGEVIEHHYTTFNEISYTCNFAKPIKQNIKNINQTQLQAYLELIRAPNDKLSFYEYNELGQLIKTRKNNTQIQMEYNAFGELEENCQSLSMQLNNTKHYLYNKLGLLEQKLESGGGLSRVFKTEYDIFGQVKALFHASGNKIRSFSYDKRGNVISIYDYGFLKTSSTQINIKHINYDAFNRVLSETVWGTNKEEVSYAYDDVKNCLTVNHFNDAKINSTVLQFNAFGDKISFTDARLETIHYIFDVKGQLLQTDGPAKSQTLYSYDKLGHLLQKQEDGQKTSYSYDAQGRILTIIQDPDGLALTTSYRYDANGRQLEIIDPNNHCKQFSYDAYGNLVKSCIDPEGLNLITTFIYNNVGELIRQTQLNPQGLDKTTSYTWDTFGRRTKTTEDPDGLNLSTTYLYDNNDNIITQIDPNGHSKHFVYDGNNHCIYQIDARGVVTEHRYSLQNEEIETIHYANSISILYDYCEESLKLAIRVTSKDQHLFRVVDLNGKVTLSVNAEGFATSYNYDANGNLIQICCFNQALSLTDLSIGNIHLPIDKADRYQYFIYDACNHLRYEIDANGYVTESSYNTRGQKISSTRYATSLPLTNKNLSEENIQNNLKQDPLKDQTTRFNYDKAGRLTHYLTATGIATGYTYDSVGNCLSTRKYANYVDIKLANQENWVDELIISDLDRINQAFYDAAGREVYQINPLGRLIERCYDSASNIIAEITHKEAQNNVPCSLNDLALMGLSSLNKLKQFNYDSIGRLSSILDGYKYTTYYSYDDNNNLKEETDAKGNTRFFYFNSMNQCIESRQAITNFSTSTNQTKKTAIITLNSYDNFGNLIKVIHDASGIKKAISYEYNLNNNKIKTIYQTANNSSEDFQSEAIYYNSFSEVIATKDRMGFYQNKILDYLGRLLYSIDAEGSLVSFCYNSFSQVISKIQYANRLNLEKIQNYSLDDIAQLKQTSTYDRETLYTYDKENRLVKDSKSSLRTYNPNTNHYEYLNPTTVYRYNVFGELIQLQKKRNTSDWDNTTNYYDKNGQKIASIDAENYLTTYDYDIFGNIVKEIEYASRSSTWNDDAYTLPLENPDDRCKIFCYDTLGRLTRQTVKNACYQELTSNNQYKNLCADLSTEITYDALGNLTSTTDAMGNSSYCYYDELSRLIAKVGPQTKAGRAATNYSFDNLGNLVATSRSANGALYADIETFLLSPSEKDIRTESVYDSQGLQIAEIDGLNHAINYAYNANGLVIRSWQLVRQIGIETRLIDKRYFYDKEGRLLQTITLGSLKSKTEENSYNAFGELIAKGLKDKLNTHLEYDSLGRVWRSNIQGYYQIYLYDLSDNKNPTQVITSSNAFSIETNEDGVDLSQDYFEKNLNFNTDRWLHALQRQDNTYDGLGHLIKQCKRVTANPTSTTRDLNLIQLQTMDRWGNILTHCSSGHETKYSYNFFNNVIRQELPEVMVYDNQGPGRLLKPLLYYAYDAQGHNIAMRDANGHTATKDIDASGKVLHEIDATHAISEKCYNLLGELVSTRNALGHLTTYCYDKANRLITLNTAKTAIHYEYDEAGLLIAQSNNLNESDFFWYDENSLQVRHKSVSNGDSYYSYDDNGHKIYETDASGNSQSWSYDLLTNNLITHIDLGKHQTTYNYNKNGLLLSEKSTSGKSLSYHYLSNGELLQYVDNGCHEVLDYSYNEEGLVISKSSSKVIGYEINGWLQETDSYSYDSLGRLQSLRRQNPCDTDNRFPNKDHAILSVDYEYDAASNIKHTKILANYTGYRPTQHDDYYAFDDNNHVIVNKGILLNGKIISNASQGTVLTYDAIGNIIQASSYENSYEEHYSYHYNSENQLDRISKNDLTLKTMSFDGKGRVIQENHFDSCGDAATISRYFYANGLLTKQKNSSVIASNEQEQEKTIYTYDNVGNLIATDSQTYINGVRATNHHRYSYALWDNYQQEMDEASLIIDGLPTTHGTSIRIYDVNGQLQEAIDKQNDNTGHSNSSLYWVSSREGIRGKHSKVEQTNYLTVAGKTIGDFKLNSKGEQQLTVYGGFTPIGREIDSAEHQSASLWQYTKPREPCQLKYFLQNNSDYDSKSNETSLSVNSPQEPAGCYTVQAGDSLNSIALQVYGDSSLAYLLADANGIHDCYATTGKGGLYSGMRLIIPSASQNQHLNASTHKALYEANLIGNTSATTPLPAVALRPLLPKHPHSSLLPQIITAVVSAVAVVLAGTAVATLAGIPLVGGLGGAFKLGVATLSGGSIEGSLGSSLGLSFAAGILGNLASQGTAKILGLQHGIDWSGLLLAGLATAASASLLRAVSARSSYMKFIEDLNKLSSKVLSISAVNNCVAENVLSQELAITFKKQNHFDWLQLGSEAIVDGIFHNDSGLQINNSLSSATGDGTCKFISTQLSSLAKDGLKSAFNEKRIDAKKIIEVNLGPSIAAGFIESQLASFDKNQHEKAKQIFTTSYCKIPYEENDYSQLQNSQTINHHQNTTATPQQKHILKPLIKELPKEVNNLTSLNTSEDLPIELKSHQDNWHLTTRLTGSLRAIEGMLELGAATLLTAASDGILSGLGYIIGVHGSDAVVTGLKQTLTGETCKLQTEHGLEKLGLSTQNASLLSASFSLGSIGLGSKLLTTQMQYYIQATKYPMSTASKVLDPLNWFITAHKINYASIIGNGILGGISGGYGAITAGSDKPSIAASITAGAAIGAATYQVPTTARNFALIELAADFTGQMITPYYAPSTKNMHLSLFSLATAAVAGGVVGKLTRYAGPTSGLIIGSMPNAAINAIGQTYNGRWS